MIQVTLTEWELRICAWVGRQRRAATRGRGADPGRGHTKDSDASNDIRGAECELVASIAVNCYWRPQLWRRGEPDIGGRYDVRSTVLPDGRLPVKPDDPDRPVILVRKDNATTFSVLGWFWAQDAKARFPKVDYGKDPAHYVDQRFLLPLDELL